MRCAVLLFAAVVPAALAAAPQAADPLKLSADEMAVIELANAERKKAGVPPLKPNAKLMEAARSHAANMAKQEKLEHELDGKNPEDRVKAAGYKSAASGENIGWNYPTPKAAVEGWMNSPPHKENLLSANYTEIGVAVKRSAKGEPYWVQVFGKPRG